VSIMSRCCDHISVLMVVAERCSCQSRRGCGYL